MLKGRRRRGEVRKGFIIRKVKPAEVENQSKCYFVRCSLRPVGIHNGFQDPGLFIINPQRTTYNQQQRSFGFSLISYVVSC